MANKGLKLSDKFVAAQRVPLRELRFPEAWLERKIREDPSILGLGNVKVVSFQRRYKNAGRADLIMLDEENGILYTVELMLGEVDSSHILRCLEYWLTESRNPENKDWYVVAVLAAENIRESRAFPVVEFLSQKMPLTVMELTALKVSNLRTLHFAKFFDGQDQLQLDDEDSGDTGRIDVDRKYWLGKRSNEIVGLTDKLSRLFSSVDRQLKVTFLQQFWGFARGQKPANFVVLVPKRKFVRVNARIKDTEKWTNKLKAAGFEVIGGTPGRSVHFRVMHRLLPKGSKVLKQLAREAYSERYSGQ